MEVSRVFITNRWSITLDQGGHERTTLNYKQKIIISRHNIIPQISNLMLQMGVGFRIKYGAQPLLWKEEQEKVSRTQGRRRCPGLRAGEGVQDSGQEKVSRTQGRSINVALFTFWVYKHFFQKWENRNRSFKYYVLIETNWQIIIARICIVLLLQILHNSNKITVLQFPIQVYNTLLY